jgi:hypothetical protein
MSAFEIFVAAVRGNLSEKVQRKSTEIEKKFSENDQIYTSAQKVAEESNFSKVEAEKLAKSAVI